jgi:hypothetical protein
LQKFATVTTNDPANAKFQLTLRIFIKGVPQPVNPGSASMGSNAPKKLGPFRVSSDGKWVTAVVRGRSNLGTLSIVNESNTPAHVTGVVAGGDNFKVTLRTVEDGKTYQLSIVTNPELKAGHYLQTAKLATDAKDALEIPIELEATVYPFVVATPTAIHLGNLPLSADIARYIVPSIYVQKVQGGGLEVKSVQSDLPFVKLETKDLVAGQRVMIQLTLDRTKAPGPGPFKGKIHIETNDQEVPSLDVTIDGTFY